MRRLILLAIALTVAVTPAARIRAASQGASIPSAPTVDDLLSLKRVLTPAISPDGAYVVYVQRETNWSDNAFETELWLADVSRAVVRQLTNAPRSSSAPEWSPDGRRIAFLSDRSGRQQVHVIDPVGGEAIQITSGDEAVTAFEWSPDGSAIAFTTPDALSETMKERVKKYGDFDAINQDHRMNTLSLVEVASRQVRRLVGGKFAIGGFEWSPNGAQIAFDHRINAAQNNSGTANISLVTVADGRIVALVTRNGPDTEPKWAPDGSHIAFVSAMDDAGSTGPRVIATVPSSGGSIKNLSVEFDEIPTLITWKQSGIYFSASQRTWAYLFHLDSATQRISRLAPTDRWIGTSFSLTKDAGLAASIVSDPATFPEVAVLDLQKMRQRTLTNLGVQTARWPQPIHDVITWTSQDGAQIEGVLHRPKDFQSGRRYPLLVNIHGGPTGTSRPVPYSVGAGTGTYPLDVWLAQGVLVLEPNYRGSAGYGEKFRSLNVRNLGIGDAWDVVSGIDHLIREGLVDSDRVGVMGWSQGGYISAFLSTHDSARFKAISVGAGISDWTTYYTNTDIQRFTLHYLRATPWEDPEIYAKTSPMTYIKQAKTPTLIQHGGTDQRVPLANAYWLYQGLRDQGTATELFVYKGFDGIGHVPTKPKSSRAVMEHNLAWFEKYMFAAPR